jgi:hypothetical protein
MDDILEPADQEALSEKIETSEFASDLIHRTRDTMRRLRLSAPQALGAGLGLDPNTVAEYLDNTLTPENVADLERICLESDVHLAEVASCHHVLTMVLGEPAEIDPDVRKRMYTISEELEQRNRTRTDAAHRTTEKALSPEARPTAASASPRPSSPRPSSRVDDSTFHEVPLYLQRSRWSFGRVAAALLATAALVTAGVYYGWGGAGAPADHDDLAQGTIQLPTAQTDGATSDDTSAEEDAADGMSADDAASVDPPPAIMPGDNALVTSEPSEADVVSEGGSTVDRYASDVVPPTEPADEMAGNEMATDDAELATTPPLPPPTTTSVEATDVGVVLNSDELVDDNASAEMDDLGGSDATDAVVRDERGDEMVDMSAGEETAELADAAQPPDDRPPTLGTFWADRDVLLRIDPASAKWLPLATGTTLKAGDNLLTLPTFRPTLALDRGIGVKLSGATSVVLGSESAMAGSVPQAPGADVPILGITFGRVVLINSGEADNPIHIVVGEVAGTLHLDPGKTVAVEVVREWVPGRDPRETPSAVRATAFAPEGGVTWTTPEQSFSVDGPSQWEIHPVEPAQPVAIVDRAEWIEGEQVGRLDRLAADQIRQRLAPGEPADAVLLDISKSQRSYERALATRCAAYVGQFAPFVRSLSDSDQRASWGLHIDTLRAAMALGPESARSVRRALFDQRGGRATDDLYEMLCGYSLEDIGMTAEQRETGALDKLINWLENDSLDYRVLAAHNLKEITGKVLLTNPTADPEERARGIRRWRERLHDGELEPLDTYGW